jgi:hypothetical protein
LHKSAPLLNGRPPAGLPGPYTILRAVRDTTTQAPLDVPSRSACVYLRKIKALRINCLLGGICGCFDDSSGPRVTEARGVLLFLTSN